MPSVKAVYWILTIPVASWAVPTELPDGIKYLRGQQEIGDSGYHHWQLVACFAKQVTLAQAKEYFTSDTHLEKCRSEAANDYVWKDESAVPDTRFELGRLPAAKRKHDWERTLELAKHNRLNDIEPGLVIRYYAALTRIAKDNAEPREISRTVNVYWGVTGAGKSHKAWEEARAMGPVYVKDPCTKWWDGYRGQKAVIIEEFNGMIKIDHLKRWLDKWPVTSENKGGATCLDYTHMWITSNNDPREWYSDDPKVSEEDKAALRRRFNKVVHFHTPYVPQ